MTPDLRQALGAITVLALVVAAGVSADADLWWHVAAGREILSEGPPHTDTWSYIASGRPWIHHEWLYGSALAAVFDTFGNPGLLLFRAAWLLLTTVAMGLAVHRRTQNAVLTVGLVGLPLPFIAFLSNLRPQTATWALVPVGIVLLDHVWAGRRWAVAAVVGLVWCWVNLHGGFLFGWGLLGLGLLMATLGLDGEKQPAAAWGILGVCMVPLLNAYGLDLLRYVATELSIGHPGLPEWNPPTGVMFGVVVLVILVTAGVTAVVRAPMEKTLLIGFAIASLASFRIAKFVQLLLLMSPIVLAPQFAELLRRLRAQPESERVDRLLRSPWTVVALTLLLALFSARLVRTPGQVSVAAPVYPVQAVRWLAEQPEPHRLLVPLGWGGIAHYHLPDWPISLDGRNTTVYEPEWVQLHTDAVKAGNLAPLLRGDPEVALVRSGRALDSALEQAGWAESFRTDTAVVYTRVPLVRVRAPDGPDVFP